MNPYGQQWGQQSSSAAPSVFGALPSLSAGSAQTDTVTYKFTNFKTTILNATVVGPGGRTAYTVTTESSAPASTIFKDTEGRNAAMILWQPNASIEIRGGGPRQRVRDWLRLASDQRCVPCLAFPSLPERRGLRYLPSSLSYQRRPRAHTYIQPTCHRG